MSGLWRSGRGIRISLLIAFFSPLVPSETQIGSKIVTRRPIIVSEDITAGVGERRPEAAHSVISGTGAAVRLPAPLTAVIGAPHGAGMVIGLR